MYRPAIRGASRRIAASALSQTTTQTGRRFASTSAGSSRGWKNSVIRLGLAGGVIYYYNTSTAFADQPALANSVDPPAPFSDEDLPTVEAVVAQKRKEAAARLEKNTPSATDDTPAASTDSSMQAAELQAPSAEGGSPEDLEQEANSQGAFNPETGEINWDCPCLGGMAHGPCGEQFRAAFSCFVYSKEDPKGIDCIEKFQGMQDCFREHPDVYGDELKDDDDDDAQAPPTQEAPAGEPAAARTATETSSVATPEEPAKPQDVDRATGEIKPERDATAVTTISASPHTDATGAAAPKS